MLAKVCSAAGNGIEAYPVEVELNPGYGDTVIVIVGLADAAVKFREITSERTGEASAQIRERVIAARQRQMAMSWACLNPSSRTCFAEWPCDSRKRASAGGS